MDNKIFGDRRQGKNLQQWINKFRFEFHKEENIKRRKLQKLYREDFRLVDSFEEKLS